MDAAVSEERCFGFSSDLLADLCSPALVFHADRIKTNIDRMIGIVGEAKRLRPHIKTHKSSELVRLQLDAGIEKFKCATLAEAEMAAAAGAKDVLIACQPVGPAIARLVELMSRFPMVRFSAVVDCAEVAIALARKCVAHGRTLDLLVDLDTGLHRTGLVPGAPALALCGMIVGLEGVNFAGLHVYDGHVNQPDGVERRQVWEESRRAVDRFVAQLERAGIPRGAIVAGGTGSFPFHARDQRVDCSPGTCVLWDYGYAARYRDLDFLWSATVLARVVSRPKAGRICLDLGTKAVASEMAAPRVFFPQLPDARAVLHNEEHLVLETESGDDLQVGSPILGVPTHICPTCALHAEAIVVRDNQVVERWRIAARDR